MIWILIAWAAANVGFGLFLALVYRANQRGMSEPVPDLVAAEIVRLETLWRVRVPMCCGRPMVDIVFGGWMCCACTLYIADPRARQDLK